MALNPARVGHRYPSYRYQVCGEKIREYAHATGVRAQARPEQAHDAGGRPLVAPPTFAACFTLVQAMASLLADPELGAHPALIHGGQEYDFHRPIVAGDLLECKPWIAQLVSRRGTDFLTLQVDCADAATKEAVVTSRSTLVFLTAED